MNRLKTVTRGANVEYRYTSYRALDRVAYNTDAGYFREEEAVR